MPRLPSCIVSFIVFLAALPVAIASAEALTSITQKERAFSVTNATIAAGSTIRFVNDDEFVHQIYVSSPDFSFDSAEQDPGQSLDLRFSVAGTFEVRCHIHPKMLLRVDVR